MVLDLSPKEAGLLMMSLSIARQALEQAKAMTPDDQRPMLKRRAADLDTLAEKVEGLLKQHGFDEGSPVDLDRD